MNKFFYLVPVVFLLSFFGYSEPYYCKLVDQITKDYIKEIANPRGLIVSGSGGAMMDNVEKIFLEIASKAPMNIDEARTLYIEMMEEFLRRINCDQKIRPYLHNFPFEEENIKLTISFINSEGRTISDGHISLMSIAKDHIIYFSVYDLEKKEFNTVHREPYEEARRIAFGK